MSGAGALLLLVFLGPRQALPVLPRPPGDENVLRLAYSQPLQLDPHHRSLPLSVKNRLVLGLWEPLIVCDPETGQPQPAAAESWEWSADRRILTLKLRRDGRWSNGDRVTAHDFVRGWRRLLRQDREVATVLYPLKNAEAFNAGRIKDPATVGVEAVDDLTLRLELAGVRSPLVTELADPLLAPLHESTEAVLREKIYWRQPEKLVTNGAFALEGANAEGFRLRPSAFYRERAQVRLGGADFVKADGWRMARLLLAAGRVDVVAPAYGSDGTKLPTNRRVTEMAEMALTITTLDLNVTRGPLRDVRVRRALSLALDRAGPMRAPDQEDMVPAFGWVPDMPGRPGLTLLHENADEARRLLAEAGYPGGKGFPVLYMPVSVSWRSYPYWSPWIDRWYHELGVRTYLAYERDDQRSARMKSGDYDIYFNGLQATVPDAGDMLGTFAAPGVYSASRWEDAGIVRLLAEADRLTGSERLAVLEQVERRAMDAVPTIPLMFERRRTLLAEEVEGWYADPLGRQSLRRLSIRQPVRPENRTALMSERPSWLPYLRDWRCWAALWLAGSIAILAVLAWDARSWLGGAPGASFRETDLGTWPVEVAWWFLAPLVWWLQARLTLLDRRWPWALLLHVLMAALITGLFVVLDALRLLVANHLPWSFLPAIIQDLRSSGRWSFQPPLIYCMAVIILYAASFYREWRAGQQLTGELRPGQRATRDPARAGQPRCAEDAAAPALSLQHPELHHRPHPEQPHPGGGGRGGWLGRSAPAGARPPQGGDGNARARAGIPAPLLRHRADPFPGPPADRIRHRAGLPAGQGAVPAAAAAGGERHEARDFPRPCRATVAHRGPARAATAGFDRL